MIPVPKNHNAQILEDFRPGAPTYLVMKSFEKLEKREIMLRTYAQFAYRAKRGVEDVVTLLHSVLQHLDKLKTFAKLLLIDFSSAFNTMQPHILVEKLINELKLDFRLVGWV